MVSSIESQPEVSGNDFSMSLQSSSAMIAWMISSYSTVMVAAEYITEAS